MSGRFSHLKKETVEKEKTDYWESHAPKVKALLEEVNQDVFDGKYEIITEKETSRIIHNTLHNERCYVLFIGVEEYIAVIGLSDGFKVKAVRHGLAQSWNCSSLFLDSTVEKAVKTYNFGN